MPNNTLNAYNPAFWANETVAILEENMVVANLINRDFEPLISKYGDTVNTRKPSELKAVRKAKTTGIVAQSLDATNIPIVLDQHVTVSFDLHDLERTYSFKDLIDTYMMPAALALSRNVDRVILGQAARFIENGRVIGTNIADTYENLVDGKVYLDKSKCYPEDRNMVMTPSAQGKLLKNKNLFPVYAAGTDAVVKKGMIGNLAGFDLYMAQNQMDVPNLTIAGTSGSQTTASASAVGTTTVTLTANTNPVIAAGQIINISGGMYTILSVAGLVVTLVVPLRENVPAGAIVWVTNGALAAGTYPVGYVEALAFTANGTNSMPTIGSILRIVNQRYTVVETGTAANTFYLDRPLADAVTTGDVLTNVIGSQINFGFHRNAITAAIRPLAAVPTGAGVLSSTTNYKGLTLRSTIGYNMTTQALQVTLDFLMGVKVLDLNLGAVILT